MLFGELISLFSESLGLMGLGWVEVGFCREFGSDESLSPFFTAGLHEPRPSIYQPETTECNHSLRAQSQSVRSIIEQFRIVHANLVVTATWDSNLTRYWFVIPENVLEAQSDLAGKD
jgi:hypothetical protein